MTQHNPIIEVKGLQVLYGTKAALQGIDFTVDEGEIFGLIGTNGAGKTSTMKALAGVQRVTSGTVRVMGHSPAQMRSALGYLTQQFSLYNDLSITENLEYYAKIRHLPDEIFQSRQKKYLEWLGLTPFVNRLGRQLSGGMKQKLALCCALITHPKILLLDEVSTGIDGVFRREIWSFLAKIAHQGITIVVATHYLDEAERCDRIALIHEGTITQMGSPQDLRTQLKWQGFEVIPPEHQGLSGLTFSAVEQVLQKAIQEKNTPFIDLKVLGDRFLIFLASNIPSPKEKIQRLLQTHQLSDVQIKAVNPTLESVMAYHLKKKSLSPYPTVSTARNLFFESPSPSKQDFPSLLHVHQVSKTYGQFQALHPLSFILHRGEIWGLLGANGAGKTTLMKLLCGLLQPSRGKIGFTDQYLLPSSPIVKQRIGYMSQKFTLYPDLTVKENLNFFGRAYRVPRQQRRERIAWILETFNLTASFNQRVGTLSGGNQQRIAFGAAILHQPDILFLDEPTTGMDILIKRQFWQILQQFARQGTAIIVTTHSMEEAEYCTNLLLMRSGKLIIQGSPTEIKIKQKETLVEIISSFPKDTLYHLEQQFEPWRLIFMGDRIYMILDQSLTLSQLENYLASITIEPYQLSPIPFSLEAAFLNLAKPESIALRARQKSKVKRQK
ncbi:MAG: ATP-binding cassette domain-containing protein [Microcystaceae cyanobacterium]